MESVIVFLECPTWEWHYDPALDSLLLTARATLRVYIFRRPFGLSMMSRHFSLQVPFSDVNMNKTHAISPVYVVPTYSELDPSMVMVLH